MRNGRLTLTARRQDLILRGGENVYPAEIELRIEEHPQVIEAAVIGVPHPSLGEEVKAIVVTQPDATITDKELIAWTSAALAYFKVPVHWELRRDALPRTATGKVMKHSLDQKPTLLVDDS